MLNSVSFEAKCYGSKSNYSRMSSTAKFDFDFSNKGVKLIMVLIIESILNSLFF